MARPRKLGPTITFRLPVELHAIADARAQAKGQTVNEYLAARITDALSKQRDGVQAASSALPPATPPERPRQVTPAWKASMKP